MSQQYSQSEADLRRLLDEQVAFLTASAEAYDTGFEGEAKRIAVAVRVLLHDTSKSTSLLKQLNLKDRLFLDSSAPLDPNNRATHGGLVFISMTDGQQSQYVAMLDDVPPPYLKWVDFDRWWGMPIFVDEESNVLSRRDLVLAVANQDGGAHVDPNLTAAYAALSKRHSLAWDEVIGKTKRRVEGAERAALRQIGHETLKTFCSDYSKQPKTGDGIVFGGWSMTVGEPPLELPNSIKVGRNSPCPCGSGKKFKRCHGGIKT